MVQLTYHTQWVQQVLLYLNKNQTIEVTQVSDFGTSGTAMDTVVLIVDAVTTRIVMVLCFQYTIVAHGNNNIKFTDSRFKHFTSILSVSLPNLPLLLLFTVHELYSDRIDRDLSIIYIIDCIIHDTWITAFG